jgi:hypothetical protein
MLRSIASEIAATVDLLANSEFRHLRLIYGGVGFQRHLFSIQPLSGL